MGIAGCSDNEGAGGSGGSGGIGGSTGKIFPCTEQGIRDAIAEGGGTHPFDCDGATTVVTEAEIVIDSDVILDGEGNLTVDGNDDHRVFSVAEGVTAELHGFAVTRGRADGEGGGISNSGTLMLTSSTVSGNSAGAGGGIRNSGMLMLTNGTVSGNIAALGAGGILNDGPLTLTNSTVSGNEGGQIAGAIRSLRGTVTLTSSTVSGNTQLVEGSIVSGGTLTMTNSVVDGDCLLDILSNGYNVESPGDTCNFGQPTDQVNVTAEQLNLGPLQDNGGPTMTHALLPGSVAIDRIPEGDCVVDADQRHVSRPRDDGCDVGAVEVDLACVGAEVGSECTHRNFTGVCYYADMCWATDCSELRDGINCLAPRNRVVFPGRCVAGSCEEETAFP